MAMSNACGASARLFQVVAGICLLSSCNRQAVGESKAAVAEGRPSQDAKPPQIVCLGKIVVDDGAVRVAAPAQAIISELRVQRGSLVQAGDIVAVLQTHDILQAAVQEAESQIAVAESALRQAKKPEKLATIAAQKTAIERQQTLVDYNEIEYQRKKGLQEQDIVPLADLQVAERNLKTSQQDLRHEREVLASLEEVKDVDVDLASKRLAAAIATRDRTRLDLAGTLIRVPRAGTVLEIYAREGEAVGSDQRVLDLGDTSQMFVEAEVYANDFPRVHEGAKSWISGQAFTGMLNGTVFEILREDGTSLLTPIDPLASADKRIVKVRIRLVKPGPAIARLSGSQVDVRIDAGL